MHPNTKFSVTAHISNGKTITLHSDQESRIFSWCEGVSQTAEAFGEEVQFVHSQNESPRWALA